MNLFSKIGRAGLLVLSLVGFKCNSPEQEVHIRIRNLTGQPIEKFWLGAGGKMGKYSTYMGGMATGAESSYHSFEPIKANYNKYNFLTPGSKRYLGLNKPEDYLGKQYLEVNHYYTFEITLASDTPQTHIILDK